VVWGVACVWGGCGMRGGSSPVWEASRRLQMYTSYAYLSANTSLGLESSVPLSCEWRVVPVPITVVVVVRRDGQFVSGFPTSHTGPSLRAWSADGCAESAREGHLGLASSSAGVPLRSPAHRSACRPLGRRERRPPSARTALGLRRGVHLSRRAAPAGPGSGCEPWRTVPHQ